jgi:hypothetical protein
MPKLRPSEMIQVIDNLFGGGRSEVEPRAVKHIHQVEVRALLSLLEDVPRELVQLSTPDLVEFTRCKSVLAAAVGRWTYGDTMPSPEVGGRDPIERIRRLLQKCPDEMPPPAPELPFISDDSLRVGIEKLIHAAWTDFNAQEWIGATALAGTALEALLLWRVKATGAFARINEMSLHDMIEHAERLQLISSSTASQARLAKDARNLMHPGRAARLGTECSKATALTAFAGLYGLVDQFNVQPNT